MFRGFFVFLINVENQSVAWQLTQNTMIDAKRYVKIRVICGS